MKKRGTIAEALLITFVITCGNALAGTLPAVPKDLKTSMTEVVSLEAQGKGVQIYECKASTNDAKRFEWVFKGPEAELFDNTGKMIGKHYAGPTWESNDGSKVIGVVKAQDSGPDPNAIPWLLLTAKSTSGDGVFSRVTSIQRLNTSGGKTPAEGCNQALADQEIRIPYKATYYFYVTKP
ncbi:MAG TPA: hypothetical protein DCP92_04220 [Nitrospiraceae bacterium]|jgi:hypothetical protein|nr:hypothetical protein [Nitrospiraceae bacterium]